jgi:hypothetical protein
MYVRIDIPKIKPRMSRIAPKTIMATPFCELFLSVDYWLGSGTLHAATFGLTPA